ncbi:MAG: thioredoxin domain-containing protein [Patescibacteria group bacterium]
MPTKNNKEKEVAVTQVKEVDSIVKDVLGRDGRAENPYLIPLSVIVAGIIIALAVLYRGDAPAGSGGNVTVGKTSKDIFSAIGLKQKDMEACLAKKQFTAKIQAQTDEAGKAGGQGTPFSVIIAANGKRTPISGAYPYEEIKRVIDEALAANPNTPPTKAEMEDPVYTMSAVSPSDHLRGDPNAPVKVVEFSDLQCPYCQVFQGVLQQVMAEYGADGKVAWAYRHFPLSSIHSKALPWAEESECAAQVGGPEKFWEYIDVRFQNQNGQ